MAERLTVLGKHTLEGIAARRGVGLTQITGMVQALVDEGLKKAEIYRRLTEGYGTSKSFVSGQREENLQAHCKRIAMKRSRNHR